MSLAEAPVTTLLYLMLVGGFYLALVTFVCCPVCLIRHGFRTRSSLAAIWRAVIFFALLLIFGALAQFIWTTTIWGRFYYSTDYVYGYMPFIPMTQRIIDFEFAGKRGALNGISLTTLNCIWLAITIPVWACTVWAYRRVFRASTPSAEILPPPFLQENKQRTNECEQDAGPNDNSAIAPSS